MDATALAAPSLILPPLRQVASPNFSSRAGRAVDLICCHDCEGNYAGSINWFANPKSQVSAHIVLRDDGGEATQMVAFANKAWHVCAFNGRSIGIEMAGYSAKGFDAPEWQAAANIVAMLLHKYGLPCTWAKGGSGQGFCSHYDLGVAGGGHKDPTTDSAVWEAFVARVEAAYALVPPANWGGVPASVAAAVPGAPRHDLVRGSLEWAQMRLNALGAAPPLNVDDLMGSKTEAALRLFQETHGLSVDGDIGPETIAALAAP